jgi:hypothetical protein
MRRAKLCPVLVDGFFNFDSILDNVETQNRLHATHDVNPAGQWIVICS